MGCCQAKKQPGANYHQHPIKVDDLTPNKEAKQ